MPESNLPGALTEAAVMAGYAPSVHNTQPWCWRVLPDRLELRADRSRQLSAADPQGRLLLISCGTALHHAVLALRAQRWDCSVDRFPNPADPDLLAVLRPLTHREADPARGEADPAVIRLLQAMRVRRTDRRPLSDGKLDAEAVAAVAAAAQEQGIRFQLLDGDQVFDLAAAAARAGEIEGADESVRDELAYWTHRVGDEGVGLPTHVLGDQAPRTTVPNRDFGAGALPIGPGHDRAAVYALLYGDDDEPESWLRAGQALSAAWLTATARGAALLPLSAAVEVPVTRAALRRLLAGLGYPYLALRLGIADPDHAGPAHTPRLPAEQFIDTSALRGADA